MASYRQTVLADGPVWYARLADTVGTTCAVEVGALTGTYINGPTLNQPSLLGISGDKAVAFSRASSQYAEVLDDNSLDLGGAGMSYEVWFATNSTNTQTFVGKGIGMPMVQMGRLGAGLIEVNVKGSGVTANAGVTTYHDGLPHYLVATLTAAGATKLYIDAVDVTNSLGTNATSNNATNLNIGRDTGVGNAMDGTLDEPALYNKILTLAQVQAHYAARANAEDLGGNRHGLLKRLDPIAEDDDIYYVLGIL